MTGKGFALVTIETESELTLEQFSSACETTPEFVIELIQHGALDPHRCSHSEIHFVVQDIPRIRRLLRLHRDLEINLQGAALALDLMDQIEQLRTQVDLLEKYLKNPL